MYLPTKRPSSAKDVLQDNNTTFCAVSRARYRTPSSAAHRVFQLLGWQFDPDVRHSLIYSSELFPNRPPLHRGQPHLFGHSPPPNTHLAWLPYFLEGGESRLLCLLAPQMVDGRSSAGVSPVYSATDRFKNCPRELSSMMNHQAPPWPSLFLAKLHNANLY